MNLPELCTNGAVLADGAWGTEMQKLGLAVGACPDVWNLEHPERVAAVAQSYVDAGSQIILTNTFRANRAALAGDIRAINRAGAEISRRVADGRAYVFASMGPTGKLLLAGEITPAEVSSAFAEQAEALAEGGADALLIETVSDLEEASLALAAARQTGLPVVVSFTFDTGRKRDRTMTGITPEQTAQRMSDEGAAAVGANCGTGIEAYLPICRRLRAATSLPIWIKPNAGIPEMQDGMPVYATAPEDFARHVPALAAAGANLVGGCCGTTPDFIRAIGKLSHAIQTHLL